MYISSHIKQALVSVHSMVAGAEQAQACQPTGNSIASNAAVLSPEGAAPANVQAALAADLEMLQSGAAGSE
jgi:hypothetical protein